MTRIDAFFKPPRFEDEEKTRQAFLLHVILWALITVPALLFVFALLFSQEVTMLVLTQAFFGVVVNTFLLILVRRGYVRSASIIQIATFWVFFTATAWIVAGVHHQAYQIGYVLVISITGFLIGMRGVLIMVGLSLLSGGLMVVASDMGLWSFKSPDKALTVWVASVILFPLLAVLQYVGGKLLRMALAQSRISQAQYRLLADNMKDQVWLMDLNLKPTYISPSVEKSRGYTFEEIVQLPLDKHLTVTSFQSAMEFLSMEMPKALADPTYFLSRSLELEFYRKDGSTLWMENTFSLIRDESGKPLSILSVGRDITERKQTEEERRSLQERLQHADKMEAIGTLAGGIAHDFNNLLMGIQGYASLSLMNLDPFNPNYERLKRIEEQVQSGADLTKQLLGFARGGRYEVKPADMNYIIEKTSSMFGRTKKEITLHKKYGKDLRTVEVDRGQMEQVFLNLYVNAWQAMFGGGEIYLETENVLLNDEQGLPNSVKPGKYVKITVTDTGIGMDEKTRERIFDPFFTTKVMGRGTGLGLATVYGIIKGHKGMINVYSEPNHGTTFTIYLPASEKEVVKEETATGESVRGTETILLVDDEKMVLEVNKELLESMGYTVYAVGSGQEAVAVYMEKRKKIDLVILDMIMPGTSGGETFDRLREINPGIKVLLSSGYSLNGEAQTIMDRGCNGFLQKPFQVQQLSSKVRAMLD